MSRQVTAEPGTPREWLQLYMQLAKSGLTAMVVMTAAVGYLVAREGAVDWRILLVTIAGVWLSSAGANGLNEWMESERDGRMQRTAGRPLPSRRMRPGTALIVSLASACFGIALLGTMTNALAALLSLATLVIYVAIYTPLKTRTTLNTLVGAVTGALPPMIGAAAATGRLGPEAWLLGGILFVWQIPHFLALAWMYRHDYAAGGFRMLPVVEPDGTSTARQAILYTLVLLPVGIPALTMQMTGPAFAIGAAILGGVFLVAGIRLQRTLSDRAARRLFFASITYLPLLLILLVADRIPPNERVREPIVHFEVAGVDAHEVEPAR